MPLSFAFSARLRIPCDKSERPRRTWHYDVLRGVDNLRNAGVKPDRRLHEAIAILIKRRHQNGRWPLNLLHAERVPLQTETAVRKASRWNTLRALRVLRWATAL